MIDIYVSYKTESNLGAGTYTIYDTTRSNATIGHIDITSDLSPYIKVSTTGSVEGENIYFSGPNDNLGSIIIKDIQSNGGSVAFIYTFDADYTGYYADIWPEGNVESISEELIEEHIKLIIRWLFNKAYTKNKISTC